MDDKFSMFADSDFSFTDDNELIVHFGIPDGKPPLTRSIDFAPQFATDQLFESDAEAVEYLRSIGRKNHTQLIKIRSKNDGTTGRLIVRWLACERSRKWKCKESNEDTMYSTKKCECPFLIKIFLEEGVGWKIHVLNGLHNHDLVTDVHAHCFSGRLTNEEKKIVKEMSEAKCKPKQIVTHINKNKDATFKVTSNKHIYHERCKLRKEAMEDRTVMQQFLYLIQSFKYYERHRKIPGKNVVGDIFFAHPESIQLLRAFPYVLIMDSTYKTNRYNMPLFEIVGFTCTWKTFCAAFAFMHSESTNNYTWILMKLKELLLDRCGTTPIAFVTDRDLALLNALKDVFPNSYSLLCRRHILKNCQAAALARTGNKDTGVAFEYSCKKLLESSTEESYLEQLAKINTNWKKYGLASYLDETWLTPYKERIVSAWCDRINHFGHHTTNRAESSHSMLKKFLDSAMGSFDTAWAHIHTLIGVQVNEVKKTFAASKMNLPNAMHLPIFKQLRYRVSRKAFTLLRDEQKRAESLEFDSASCGCWLRYTYALPCAHEIAQMKQDHGFIPLSSVHRFWKQLDVDFDADDGDDLSKHITGNDEEACLDAMMQDFVHNFLKMPVHEKRKYVSLINDMWQPTQTTLEEPPVAITKGRPKKNPTTRDPSLHERLAKKISQSSKGRVRGSPRRRGRPPTGLVRASPTHVNAPNVNAPNVSAIMFPFANCVPRCMIEYIRSYVNVRGDGNCGFRSLSVGLFGTEDEWASIRRVMLDQLRMKQHLFQDTMDVERVMINLSHFEGTAPISCWMDAIEIGNLFATAHQVALVVLSEDDEICASYTYLPLTASHGMGPPDKIVYIAFLRQHIHYIALNLVDDAPMPDIFPLWFGSHDATVEGWEEHYAKRIAHYRQIHTPKFNIDLNVPFVDLSSDS